MKHLPSAHLAGAALALSLLVPAAARQVAPGLLDPDVATVEELAALPGFTPELVTALVEARPFDGAPALDRFLQEQGLDDEARAAVYALAFEHVNLNTAEEAELRLVPGVGKRMAHELQEYRPWRSFAQFDKEIGKYVDETELDRLRSYFFIPLDLNAASEADLLTIPGVGRRMAHELQEYRPWRSKAQFEKEIGKYVDEKEVARLWRYVVLVDAEDEGR